MKPTIERIESLGVEKWIVKNRNGEEIIFTDEADAREFYKNLCEYISYLESIEKEEA